MPTCAFFWNVGLRNAKISAPTFSSLEDYSRWKAETLAYYSQTNVETAEPLALDLETRLKKRKEYLENELKKKK